MFHIFLKTIILLEKYICLSAVVSSLNGTSAVIKYINDWLLLFYKDAVIEVVFQETDE